MDDLERAVLLQLGDERRMISDLEESGIAARQTVHTRVEQLVREGYIQEEREQKLPFRRYLSLTEKGRQVLELELSRDRAELEERAEGERDIYKTGWFFRDFVHRDLEPRESVVKGALKILGTLGIGTVYRDIFQPAFKPSENERDYAELLMHLLIDPVDYQSLFERNARLKAFAQLYPAYKRVIARETWSVTTGFKERHFDYLSVFEGGDILKLVRRPFVSMLEKNYLEILNEECSRAAGEPVRLDRDSFLKILCWMRLKERSLSYRAYEGLLGPLLLVALADLGLIDRGKAEAKLLAAAESSSQVRTREPGS